MNNKRFYSQYTNNYVSRSTYYRHLKKIKLQESEKRFTIDSVYNNEYESDDSCDSEYDKNYESDDSQTSLETDDCLIESADVDSQSDGNMTENDESFQSNLLNNEYLSDFFSNLQSKNITTINQNLKKRYNNNLSYFSMFTILINLQKKFGLAFQCMDDILSIINLVNDQSKIPKSFKTI